MPIHEYQCERCGHVVEKIIWKMDDVEKTIVCPNCKISKAKKIMSLNGAFIINGYNAANGYDTVMR